jgi:hypothetical protein
MERKSIYVRATAARGILAALYDIEPVGNEQKRGD